jgi:enolase
VRKAWTIICCALCLAFLSFPLSGFAASKEIYYTVKGNQKVVPGIYKAVPNGKAVPVLKEKNYKMKEVSKPPVRLEDANLFYVNERAAQAADYEDYFELNNQPIQDVQVVGKDLYFTKLLVRSVYAGSCGGGGADILEIYKRSSNGKITKVTSDRVSSDAKNRFKVISPLLSHR